MLRPGFRFIGLTPDEQVLNMQTALAEMTNLAVDTRRIRKELGYEEGVPRDEALMKTIAWERANPPAEVDPKQFDYAAEDALIGTLKYGHRDLA